MSTLSELINSNTSLSVIRDKGYSVKQIVDLTFDMFSAIDFLDAGYSIQNILATNGFFSLFDLYDAGISIPTLINNNYNLLDFLNNGFTVSLLKPYFLLINFYNIFINQLSTNKILFIEDLKNAGYTIEELKNAGFTIEQIESEGEKPTINELYLAFTIQQIKDAGYTAIAFKNAGFTATQLKKGSNFTASELKAAEFTLLELKEAGYGIVELLAGGYTMTELYPSLGFTLREYYLAGVASSELYSLGASASDLIAAGYETYCLNRGTRILCVNEKGEEYEKVVEELKVGDLVKSYKHGNRKIQNICEGELINDISKIRWSMYKMKESGLIVTGGHSIMVDKLSEEEYERTISEWEIQEIDENVLLMAGYSSKFEQIQGNEKFIHYNFNLENNGNENKRYGVYANGVLVETPSEKTIKGFKNVK